MSSHVSRALVDRVREESGAFFRGARGSHDWDHTERVYRLCQKIGRKEGADPGVLALAALLHDIGRAEEDRAHGRICHARAGAIKAQAILKRLGCDRATIAAVTRCIATHRFRRGGAPRSIEARVLYDADKLDSIGAVGVGRAFLFAGEVGARLHDPSIDVRKTRPYTKDDTAYREYLVKLSRVKERMTTREGRRLASDRHRYMAGFFARLNKETAGAL
jgi:uncharacterized protein